MTANAFLAIKEYLVLDMLVFYIVFERPWLIAEDVEHIDFVLKYLNLFFIFSWKSVFYSNNQR